MSGDLIKEIVGDFVRTRDMDQPIPTVIYCQKRYAFIGRKIQRELVKSGITVLVSLSETYPEECMLATVPPRDTNV